MIATRTARRASTEELRHALRRAIHGSVVEAALLELLEIRTAGTAPDRKWPDCSCYRCASESGETTYGIPLNATRMALCEYCGNKRCPHASDHRHACTRSNEPGQPGSRF